MAGARLVILLLLYHQVKVQTLCPDPADIVNGMVTFTGKSVNDTATYTCIAEFELIGSALSTCAQVNTSSAAFSPAAPECRRLTVDITVAGTDPPDFPESGTEYRAASGPYAFTCTATGGSGSSYQYEWTSTCGGCSFVRASATGETSAIFRQALHSGDSGTHTCTATRGGASVSDSIDLIIVGAGIFVFIGDGATGAQPNNGLVISRENPGSGRNFRFFCRSDSTTLNIGELIGLDGNKVMANTFFQFEDPEDGGELRVESMQAPLTSSQQGIYTCRISLENGNMSEINIGVYPSEFDAMPDISNPLMFTPGSSSSNLICSSTGSPATTVTFMRGTTVIGPLFDGQSMEVNNIIYQLTQTVINRQQSTYENVLTINQLLTDIVDSIFTCSVANTLGTSPPSQPLIIGVLGPPLNFMLTMQGTTTLSFSWDPPVPRENVDITHYRVRCEPQLVGIPTPAAVTQSASQPLTATVSSLFPGVTYDCTVAAISDRGEGDQTEDTAMTQEIAPGPVSNILWNPQSSSSVIVSWSEPERPNGIILGYSVVLERYVGGIIDSADIGSNTFTTLFRDTEELVAETPYNVTVTATNSAGMGDPEEVVNFTLESNSPPPPSHLGIVRSNDGTQMIVSWTPLTVLEARSLIQFYRVFYTPGGSSRKKQSGNTCIQSPCDVPGTERSVLIIGLKSGTNYTVIVATINGRGEQGVFSPIQIVKGVIMGSAGNADNTAAIVGGVVAGLLVIVIVGAVTAIVIVMLVLRHRDHRSRLSIHHDKPVQWSEVAKSGDLDIKTTECVAYPPVNSHTAYDQTQQIPSIQEDVTYEVIPGEIEPAPAHTQRPTESEYETVRSV